MGFVNALWNQNSYFTFEEAGGWTWDEPYGTQPEDIAKYVLNITLHADQKQKKVWIRACFIYFWNWWESETSPNQGI